MLIEANARVLDHLTAEGTLRGAADSADICRLVMGVAAVADYGSSTEPPCAHCSRSWPAPCLRELLH
jgi:hypothetical protein